MNNNLDSDETYCSEAEKTLNHSIRRSERIYEKRKNDCNFPSKKEKENDSSFPVKAPTKDCSSKEDQKMSGKTAILQEEIQLSPNLLTAFYTDVFTEEKLLPYQLINNFAEVQCVDLTKDSREAVDIIEPKSENHNSKLNPVNQISVSEAHCVPARNKNEIVDRKNIRKAKANHRTSSRKTYNQCKTLVDVSNTLNQNNSVIYYKKDQKNKAYSYNEENTDKSILKKQLKRKSPNKEKHNAAKKLKIQISENHHQSQLPTIYPAHFTQQTIPETFFRNDLKTKRPVRFNELEMIYPTPEVSCLEMKLTDESSTSISSLSLTESLQNNLCNIFGTDDVKEIVGVDEKIQFKLRERHVQALAFVLNVNIDILKTLLNKICQLNQKDVERMLLLNSPTASSSSKVECSQSPTERYFPSQNMTL